MSWTHPHAMYWVLDKYTIPIVILLIFVFEWVSPCSYIHPTSKGQVPYAGHWARQGRSRKEQRPWPQKLKALEEETEEQAMAI